MTDKNPYFITNLLFFTNILLFFSGLFLGIHDQLVRYYAFSMAQLVHGRIDTIIAAGFLHKDIPHLAYNMLFLWVFGQTCEEELGAVKTGIIYVAAMVSGSLLFAFLFPTESAIGASGAIAGLVAAALLLAPGRPVHPSIPMLPVGLLAVGFIVPAIMNAFSLADNIANIAHVGGVIAGTVLAFLWDSDRARTGIIAAVFFAVIIVGMSLIYL